MADAGIAAHVTAELTSAVMNANHPRRVRRRGGRRSRRGGSLHGRLRNGCRSWVSAELCSNAWNLDGFIEFYQIKHPSHFAAHTLSLRRCQPGWSCDPVSMSCISTVPRDRHSAFCVCKASWWSDQNALLMCTEICRNWSDLTQLWTVQKLCRALKKFWNVTTEIVLFSVAWKRTQNIFQINTSDNWKGQFLMNTENTWKNWTIIQFVIDLTLSLYFLIQMNQVWAFLVVPNRQLGSFLARKIVAYGKSVCGA